MAGTSQLSDRGRLAALLEYARRTTMGLLEGIPTERYCWQAYQGANHVLWVLGHLAVTDAFALRQFGECAPGLPETYQALFGPGSAPVQDSGAYPSRIQVMEALRAQRARLSALLATLSADDLAQPLASEIRWFAVDGADLFLKLCWHESLHAGQITAVRKSLRLAPWRFRESGSPMSFGHGGPDDRRPRGHARASSRIRRAGHSRF